MSDKTIEETSHPSLHSPGEFMRDMGGAKRLMMKYRKPLAHMKPAFRETICLTVTLANKCKV